MLCALALWADGSGAFDPGEDSGARQLAAGTGLSNRTVRTALLRLRDLGAVEIEPRLTPKGGRSSNLYRVTVHRMST